MTLTSTRCAAARALAVLVLAGAALTMAGCSSVDTAPDQVALHYAGGGVADERRFETCVGSSELHNFDGVGETYAYYPTGQRAFKFSTDEGADAGPLTASTRDQQELVVRGVITFTLNTSCKPFTDADGRRWPGGKLQKFHELIGRKFSAAADGPDVEPPAGWDKLLGVYIKDIADRAIDNEALRYGWEQLYNDAAKKAQWEKDVIAAIPDLVKRQAGEDYFTINSIVLQKPDIADVLKGQLAAKQAAVLRGQASEVDKATAKNWPGGISAYLDYQRQLAVNKAIEEGKVKVLPIPQGSAVIVQGG